MALNIEDLTDKVADDITRFQHQHHLSLKEMTDILLILGVDSYLKDMATRQLNGVKAPYLAGWHLRQGIKYYRQDLEGRQ